MDRNTFLNFLVDDGIEEIRHTYVRPDQESKRSGGIKGFEACRGKSDEDLLELWHEAKSLTRRVDLSDDVSCYWHQVMYERQIEWVLNVLSAAMRDQGREPLTDCTLRGYLKARDILGSA